MISVSVIVPVYNTEAYLRACLEALAGQTLPEVEFICVDDGSTDGSAAILDEFAARDARFRVFHQANAGQASARNFGLDQATGEFIMFCDSDDRYEPTMCARMVETIRRERVDLVQCRNSWSVAEGVPEAVAAQRRNERYFNPERTGRFPMCAQEILNNNVFIWQRIFRRKLIVSHGIRFPDGHEIDDDSFCYQYGIVAREVFYLPEALYVYTIRSASVMDSYFRKAPRNREDSVYSAAWTVDFAIRNELAVRWLEFLWEIVGLHYRTCRDFYPRTERPALLARFNAILGRLPGRRRRIVDMGKRTMLISDPVAKGTS